MGVTFENPPISLGMAGTLMTAEEFDSVGACDEGYRYELIRGVLVVTPVPLPEETGPNERLGQQLLNYLDQHPQGSSLDYTLMEQYVRTRINRHRADRLIWAGLGRVPNLRRDVPTIAVEFVSRSRKDRERDYIEKRAEYLEIGIAEYWVIDRFRRILTIFKADGSEMIVKEGEIYRTPLLPGFELPLDLLLAASDLWEGQEDGAD